jgi:hypothetical protein
MIVQFDYMFFISFISVICTLGWVAHNFADQNPSQKRLINVEKMIESHLEESKKTKTTIINIKDKLIDQSNTLTQILEKLP